jgi:hypothetical protein
MPGSSTPRVKPATTKEKARKKLGEKIRKEKSIKRLKGAKIEKALRQSRAQPEETPVLRRT